MKRLKLALFAGGLLGLIAGTVAVLMPRPAQAEGQSATPLTSTSCGVQETTFGNLTADALAWASGAQLAIVPAISFRAGTLAPGPVTADRVRSLLNNPDETYSVSRLTGAQIRAALEQSVHSAPLTSTSFLQVSTQLRFTYSAQLPRGQRVSNVRVSLNDLRDEATYLVAMPTSLARGGSGYFRYFGDKQIDHSRDTKQSLTSAIVDYAADRQTIKNDGFGRITAAKTAE